MTSGRRIEIDDLGPQDLAPAEGQELSGQGRGSPARTVDPLDLSPDLALRRDALQQQPGVPHDRGQQIVEVVRHASCQPADGLHPLRLLELLVDLSQLALERAIAPLEHELLHQHQRPECQE